MGCAVCEGEEGCAVDCKGGRFHFTDAAILSFTHVTHQDQRDILDQCTLSCSQHWNWSYINIVLNIHQKYYSTAISVL